MTKFDSEGLTTEQRKAFETYATYSQAEDAGEGDAYLGAIDNLSIAHCDRLNGARS